AVENPLTSPWINQVRGSSDGVSDMHRKPTPSTAPGKLSGRWRRTQTQPRATVRYPTPGTGRPGRSMAATLSSLRGISTEVVGPNGSATSRRPGHRARVTAPGSPRPGHRGGESPDQDVQPE